MKNLWNLKYVFLMVLLLAVDLIHAAQISEQQANKVAVTFLKSQTGNNSLKAVLHFKQVDPDGSVDFYVFNFIGFQGFVIVTGDDNLEPVIAYSTESSFDISSASKSGVSTWMSDIHGQVRSILKQNLQADTRISGLWSAYSNGTVILNPQTTAVAPLLTTTWDQTKIGSPSYNSLCPYDAAASNQRCLTGCTATAMAQIMKYWNYPAHGTGSHSYTDNHGVQSANFGATTYNWSQMPDVLTSSSTNDVDILMYHCGVSVEMDYEANFSGAYVLSGYFHTSAQDAYVDYFGYSSSIQGLCSWMFQPNAWIALIKNELDEKRPVQYVGDGPAGKHTWVCDGYNASNQFHMNWGWGGSHDGYFSLTSLNPGTYSFNSTQQALIGIRPSALSSCDSYWNLSGSQHYDYMWQSSDYITSCMNILSNTHAAYTAENQIILTPGFRANLNSNFSAKIQPCITTKISENPSVKATGEEGDIHLSVYPNPFTDNLTIEFELSDEDNISVKLVDIMGNRIREISNSFRTKGRHNIRVNASDLPAGIYFVMLQGSGYKAERKIIKIN